MKIFDIYSFKGRCLCFLVQFLTLFLMPGLAALAQKVSDVTASQQGNRIVVSYTLDKFAGKVSLMVSLDGGKTFSAPLQKVSGNVSDVQPGRRAIVWDVLAERKSLTGSQIVFSLSVMRQDYDLSSQGTANCYIVSAPGTYTFKATVKGSSSVPLDGIPATAVVLWESFGTNVTPSVGDVINSVSYSDGEIKFSTPMPLNNGNAVIAVKNASGKILWSWHIWVCDGFDPEATAQVYKNNAGTMMDRNLGATSATPGDVHALGLLYQWGRKDPFLGSSSISSSTVASSTLSWPSSVSSSSSTGTIAYAVSHPTTFVTCNDGNVDWYYGSRSTDNTRWQTSDKDKGMYDPCPAGWRVPDGGESDVWSKAFGSSFRYENGPWNDTNRGMDFGGGNGKGGAMQLGSSSTIWYPAAGCRNGNDGALNSDGNFGAYWSCMPNGVDAYYLNFGLNGDVYPSLNDYYRVGGRSVRCLSESK